MLKDRPINSTAIKLQKILDGKLKCDTYNLRICYYNHVVEDKADLENALLELKKKNLYNKKDFQDFVETFEEKIDIYNKYLELLEKRENAECWSLQINTTEDFI